MLEAAGEQSLKGTHPLAALERVAAYVATDGEGPSRPAVGRVRRAQARGPVEGLLIDHRHAWAERWEEADVRIEGDSELQLAVRLALFHLIGSAAATAARRPSARAV